MLQDAIKARIHTHEALFGLLVKNLLTTWTSEPSSHLRFFFFFTTYLQEISLDRVLEGSILGGI